MFVYGIKKKCIKMYKKVFTLQQNVVRITVLVIQTIATTPLHVGLLHSKDE